MKILVTGATGFLGSHIIKSLVAKNIQIIVLKRSYSDTARLNSILHRIHCYNLDQDGLSVLFQKHAPIDAIIHTATCYGRRGETAQAIVETNINFPLQLIDSAIRYKTSVFINTDTSLDRFTSRYALSKKQFMEWGRHFADQERIRFINIVLEHFYGVGDDDSKFITHVIRKCLQNVPYLQLTAGEQLRDFIHIDDVVMAYLLVLDDALGKSGLFFQEYGLGSGEAVTIRETVERIHHICGSKTLLQFGALPYRQHEVFLPKTTLDSLLRIGWKPMVSFDEGLKNTICKERESLMKKGIL